MIFVDESYTLVVDYYGAYWDHFPPMSKPGDNPRDTLTLPTPPNDRGFYGLTFGCYLTPHTRDYSGWIQFVKTNSFDFASQSSNFYYGPDATGYYWFVDCANRVGDPLYSDAFASATEVDYAVDSPCVNPPFDSLRVIYHMFPAGYNEAGTLVISHWGVQYGYLTTSR